MKAVSNVPSAVAPKSSAIFTRSMNLLVSSRRSSGVAEPKLIPKATFTGALLDRDEDAVANLALDRLREVALARRILDEDDLARPDHARLAVAGGELPAGVEVDDVLAGRGPMPGQGVRGVA